MQFASFYKTVMKRINSFLICVKVKKMFIFLDYHCLTKHKRILLLQQLPKISQVCSKGFSAILISLLLCWCKGYVANTGYAMYTSGKVLRVKNVSLFQMCLTILKYNCWEHELNCKGNWAKSICNSIFIK